MIHPVATPESRSFPVSRLNAMILNRVEKMGFFNLLNNRFVKFLIVGGINTVFGYGVFALLIFLKFHYAVAALLATILGILFNFKTTGTIVFKNSDNSLLFKFIGVYAVLYFINTGVLKIFHSYSVNMYLAGALLIFPSAALSFLLNKKFVFINE